MNHRIGIIGAGVVGAAHANVFRHYADVKVFDTDSGRATHNWRQTIQQQVLFLCVPTPMRRDGSVDRSVVEGALEEIRAESHACAVILKSTLPPNDLVELSEKFVDGPMFVFSPEFLTERTAEYDLQQSTRFLFGSRSWDPDAVAIVENLFERRFHRVPRRWVSLECASLVKYFTNVFFATKVALLNEFQQIAGSFGRLVPIDGQGVIDLMMLDPRIGRSHFQVPGHDGMPGFGGACFLKDINGYMHLARAAGASTRIAQAAWISNVNVRGSDTIAAELEKLIGRAASEPFTAADVERLGA